MPGLFYVSFLPVLMGLVLAGLVIYWDHRRDSALIRHGLYLPVSRSQGLLAWGLVLTGGGSGLFVGSFWVGLPEGEVAGLVVTFVGIALVVLSAFLRVRRPAP